MNDISQQNTPSSTTPGPRSSRTVRGHRLSSPAIAILVIGSVLAAGAVGAVIGGASQTRTVPSGDISLPDASQLQPSPLTGSSLGSPAGRTSTASLGAPGSNTASFAPQNFRGQAFANKAITEEAITEGAIAAQATPTTKLTTLTLAPRPRPGAPTTIKRTATTKARPVTTTTEAPPVTEGTEGTDGTDAPVETIEPLITIPTVPPRTPTTTRPSRQQQQQGHQLGSGIVVVPAPGYTIGKKWENGEVIIGNQFSYIHTWVEQAGDTSNLPATQVVDYISTKILPQDLQDVQASQAKAVKPSKTSISSMASAGFQGLLSGQQGSTDVEGFSFSAVRPDGTVLLFFAVVKSGSFEQAQGPISQMLGSILSSM